jgi:hypothetical protein
MSAVELGDRLPALSWGIPPPWARCRHAALLSGRPFRKLPPLSPSRQNKGGQLGGRECNTNGLQTPSVLPRLLSFSLSFFLLPPSTFCLLCSRRLFHRFSGQHARRPRRPGRPPSPRYIDFRNFSARSMPLKIIQTGSSMKRVGYSVADYLAAFWISY